MDTKKLRQKILDLAIRGKLVPQDPNDEPASVLLERIRAEKERLIKEGKIKRSKNSASSDTPHYENEVPFEVPEGWEWCIVDDFAYVASGSTPSKDSFVEKGVPYIKMYNLRNQKIDFDFHPQYIKREVHEGKLQRSKTEVGDLIMNIVGPPLGKLAIIPPSLPESNFNQAAVLIRPYLCKDVLVKYLFYYLSEMSEINSISTKGTAGQVNISLTQSQNMRIALPPIEEQKRIISTIDNLFQIIDIIDKGSVDISTAIGKAKSKILDLAIHGKLVPQDPNDEPAIELLKRINPKFSPCDNAHYENVPEGWCTIYVGDLAGYTNGKAFKPSDWERNGLPIIRIQNLNDENCQYNYTSITHEEKYRISHGDLLFAWAASLGVYIWQGNKAWLNQHIFKVDPHPFIDKQYLYYIFEYLVSEFYTRSHGSGMVHITKKEFETTIALLPPLSEQRRIVKSIKSYYTTLDNISANL